MCFAPFTLGTPTGRVAGLWGVSNVTGMCKTKKKRKKKLDLKMQAIMWERSIRADILKVAKA